MKRVCLSLLVALVLMFGVPSYAEQTAEEVLKAIVKVRSIVPSDAHTARSLGTEREGNGVVIDSDGHILTIGYLIIEAENIKVVVPAGKPVSATFVAYDHTTGFGLLRANDPLGVAPVKLGRSSELSTGDPVLVASHGGQEWVQGARVVSRSEFAGYWEYLLDNAIITAPPHPSFGGAALLGPDGKLLGIGSLLTQVAVPSLGSVACNIFVPIDLLKPILTDLITKGRSAEPPRPWLGVNAEEAHGRVFVVRVTSGGPAEQAGIKPGDIILEVNTNAVYGLADFYRKVWALGRAGVDVPLSILQGTQIRKIVVHSADRYQYLRIRGKKAT